MNAPSLPSQFDPDTIKRIRRSHVRRRLHAVGTTALFTAAAAAMLTTQAKVLVTLAENAWAGLSWKIWTESTPPPGIDGGGLLNSIVGSVLVTTPAVLASTLIGVMSAIYMVEYGRKSRLTKYNQIFIDTMSSFPSIITGLAGYEAVVKLMGNFSGIAGSAALMLIATPIITRSAQDALELVPNELKKAAYILGFSKAHTVRRITWPIARKAVRIGIIFATARIAGETAPLFFTVLGNQFFSINIFKPMATLPTTIYNFAMSSDNNWQKLAWTGAAILTAAPVLFTIAARYLSARQGKAKSGPASPSTRVKRPRFLRLPNIAIRPRDTS